MKTEITYLLEIDILGTTVRFSSNGDTSYGGKSYVDGLTVQTVNDNELRISLPNHRQQSSSLFLNEPIRGKSVRLLVMMNGVASQKFSGVGDSLIKLTNSRADIRAVSFFGEGKFPSLRIAPPVFNHITPSGTIIKYNGQTVEVK